MKSFDENSWLMVSPKNLTEFVVPRLQDGIERTKLGDEMFLSSGGDEFRVFEAGAAASMLLVEGV